MVTCKECNKEVETNDKRSKFCSRSCSATYNNRGVARNPKKQRVQCRNCGTTVSERYNKYCKQCIEKGVHTAARITQSLEDAKTDRTRRKILIRDRGHSCSVCKGSEWNGKPIPLEIDHINGDASNSLSENVRLICPNCHAQTDTYKEKNKGNSKRKFYVVFRRNEFIDSEEAY